jgi:hypothetical protein
VNRATGYSDQGRSLGDMTDSSSIPEDRFMSEDEIEFAGDQWIHTCPGGAKSKLTGKVAVVTGASKGIGAAIAKWGYTRQAAIGPNKQPV